MKYAPHISQTSNRACLSDGMPGIFETVALMRQLVNEYKTDLTIRQAAISCVFLTPEKDQGLECESVFNYVRDHIRYVRDIHNVETVSTPDKIFASQVGDCDDQSTLLATMLESVGYPTRFICAGYQHPENVEHVYVQVFTGADWVDCDPTEQKPFGYAPPNPVCLFVENI